uniref:NADH dehydrogenase [ubiquinone] 1 subunit C2 n=1 Tax=Riptortus pedestris TaxID=329032 RepID=R4WTL5_RIPPE|nr:NADH ubiquinone oxidoreductase B14.5B [Riptortus pedestris]
MAIVPDPRKLLLLDPEYRPSFLSDKFFPMFAGVLGFSAVVASRYASRRPLFSGIQHHILSTSIAGVLATIAQQKYQSHNAEKDAIYRHYIELHPEDFPIPERKKIGEIFPKFTPVR